MDAVLSVQYVAGILAQWRRNGNDLAFYAEAVELTRRAAAQAHGIPVDRGSTLPLLSPADVNSNRTQGRNHLVHKGPPDQ